jgi:sulfotransferase
MSRKNDASVLLSDAQRASILRGLFSSYYDLSVEGRCYFDTNRVWCAKMPTICNLFEDARVICCVRSVAWVVDSFERLAQTNYLELSGLFGYETKDTVFSRAQRLAASDGLVGFALEALKEAFYGPYSDRMILIGYDALVSRPQAVIREIYEFIGEAPFKHDFENVALDEREFDTNIGTPGLHTVRKVVEAKSRKSILPPEIFEHFAGEDFWLEAADSGEAPRMVL